MQELWINSSNKYSLQNHRVHHSFQNFCWFYTTKYTKVCPESNTQQQTNSSNYVNPSLMDFKKNHCCLFRHDLKTKIYSHCSQTYFMFMSKENQFLSKGNALKQISDFLRNRNFRVHFNGGLSKIRKTWADVPQSIVLSPFLFLLYINNIYHQLFDKTRI